MAEITEYTQEIENLFIDFLFNDPELYVRCKGIIDPHFFESNKNSDTIKFMNQHYLDHSDLPTREQIKSVVGKDINELEKMHDSHRDWFLDEFETFCRHKGLEHEILQSTTLLEKKRYGEVEDRIKKAVQIGLVKDLGTNYFDKPHERLEDLRDNSNLVSTGWKDIDRKLYGGFEKGGLNIFAGQSGSGKSLFLQNLAINWAQAGMNVVYISLELSEKLCSMRLDAMISNYATNEVLKNIDDVSMRVGTFKKKFKGNMVIKQMPNGCTANDIRAYIKELEIQSGNRVDAILLDYLDLCMPMSVKVSPSDMFVKDKYVSEELRNLAMDLDIMFCTASQLNRASHEEIEFDHSHISGGISKINTADNVMGIFVTPTMKENGRYQIQFLKTRSSSGVGSKVDLKFNVKSLRIEDLDEDEASATEVSTASMIDQLKKKSVLNNKTESEKVEDSGDDVLQASADLRALLKRK
jgi:hypothetical protein